MKTNKMTNQEILSTILSSYKTITAYYPVAGGDGLENIIAETNDYNGKKYNQELKNIVNLAIQLGAAATKHPNGSIFIPEYKRSSAIGK